MTTKKTKIQFSKQSKKKKKKKKKRMPLGKFGLLWLNNVFLASQPYVK